MTAFPKSILTILTLTILTTNDRQGHPPNSGDCL